MEEFSPEVTSSSAADSDETMSDVARPIAIFTGKKDTYDSGAQREETGDRPMVELLSPYATFRIARIAAFGAQKYSPRNWEKGIPLSRFMASIYRHLIKLHMGMEDEDHAAMVGWNIQAFIHTKHLIDTGKLPKELDDMPYYESRSMDELAQYLSKE